MEWTNLKGYGWQAGLEIMLRKETLVFLKCRSESRSGSLKQGEKIGKCPSKTKSYPSHLLSFLNQFGKHVGFVKLFRKPLLNNL